MAMTKEQRWAKVHEEALIEFDRTQSAQRAERLECLADRRFYSIAGAQWEGALGDQFENKPRFEVNKVHLAIIKIINEYRNNRITVKFVPKDGTNADMLSDTCNGLYRADEQDSCAEEAYDNAFEEAASGGFGAWRLRTKYEDDEDEDDERQRVAMEPIFDADSCVFFNIDAKRQDKADAKKCWVLTPMTPEAYIEEYGDDPATWPHEISLSYFDVWYKPNDYVYVAEYYVVEEKTYTVHIYRGLDDQEKKVTDEELEDDPELEETLQATGFQEIRQKKVKKKVIHKYLMSGGGILEDCGYIAGRRIPIVPVFGKRWVVDGIERMMGHVRLAKDAQRLKNMQLSKLGEFAALSSVEKPIFTPEQMKSHTEMWSNDNIENYPYLLVNPVTDPNNNVVTIGPVAYTKVAQIPPAMAALLQVTEQDMQDILGNSQSANEMNPGVSGIAVELIQSRLDMQTFIYMSNMAKAVKCSGEIWLGMNKDILVEQGRKMKVVNEQGETDSIELLRPVINDKTGEKEYENDMSDANFDVAVEVGPSSMSRRNSTVRTLTQMMQISQDPETLRVLGAMAMMNMEGEGISEVRDYFRNQLLKMGVVKPTKEETAQMAEAQAQAANQPPDANTQFLLESAKKASAEADKAVADTIKSLASAKELEASAAEKLANIDITQQNHVIQLVSQLGEHFNTEQQAVTTQPQPVSEI